MSSSNISNESLLHVECDFVYHMEIYITRLQANFDFVSLMTYYME